MRRIAALTAALALTTAAAPVPLAGAHTSEASFNHRANAACAAAGKKIGALPATDEKSIAKNFRAEVKIINTMIKRLDGIEAPKASKRQYREFIKLNREQVRLVQQTLAAAASRKTDRAAALLFQVVKKGRRGVQVATDLDLTDCARDYYPGVSGTPTG